MNLKRMFKILICLSIVFTILASSSVLAEDSLEDLESRRQQLKDENEKLDKQLEDARSDIKNKEALKDALNAKISAVQGEINVLGASIDEYNARISEKENQIRDKQNQIKSDIEKLKTRLRAIYIAGDVSSLEIILGAKDFSDFIDKAYLVQSVSTYDQKLIDGLKDNIESIKDEKTQIDAEKAIVVKAKTEQEKKMNEMTLLQEEYDSVISGLRSRVDEIEGQMEANSEESDALAAEIADWHRQYIIDNGGLDTPTYSGEYVWPCPSLYMITDYWGAGRGHKGIDISGGGAYGSSVVASADGVVIKANASDYWGDGWGFYVMIDHGGGYATQYAHLSNVSVSVGQHVSAGEYIGAVGNSGDSYGAHLHFECWYNGDRFDPAQMLGV